MKVSVQFAKAKWEAIEHIRANIFPTNQARAKTMFPVMMEKIRIELKGEKQAHTFTRPDGKTVTVNVIMFPDKSFAAVPRLAEMLPQADARGV